MFSWPDAVGYFLVNIRFLRTWWNRTNVLFLSVYMFFGLNTWPKQPSLVLFHICIFWLWTMVCLCLSKWGPHWVLAETVYHSPTTPEKHQNKKHCLLFFVCVFLPFWFYYQNLTQNGCCTFVVLSNGGMWAAHQRQYLCWKMAMRNAFATLLAGHQSRLLSSIMALFCKLGLTQCSFKQCANSNLYNIDYPPKKL